MDQDHKKKRVGEEIFGVLISFSYSRNVISVFFLWEARRREKRESEGESERKKEGGEMREAIKRLERGSRKVLNVARGERA